jgi:hydroxysqualene synthase
VISRVVGSEKAGPVPTPPAARPGAHLEVGECYRYCDALVRAHHENFPVASRFLPARLRPHVCALYAFVRSADDFADEPAFAGRRAEELARWDDLLHRCFHDDADHPIFVALADTVHRFDLPIGPFSDLLAAFRMDLRVRRFSTFAELMGYVARAAHPIGRLLLYIFGVRDVERQRYADDLAAALALTSFWQDTARDLVRDRIYLPAEDLLHFGVSEADLRAGQASRALTDLIRFQTARTRAYYLRSRPLLDKVEDELRIEIAMFWHGGARVLDKVQARGAGVLAQRPTLSTVDKAWVLAKAYAKLP